MANHRRERNPTAARTEGTSGLAGGISWVAIAYSIPVLVGIVTMPVLARSLGVGGRGELAAGTAPLLLGTVALTFGLPDAVTFIGARNPGLLQLARRRGMRQVTLLGVLGTGGIIGLAPLLSPDDSEIRTLIVLASLALVPTLLVAVARAAAMSQQRWGLVAAEQTVSAVFRVVVLFGLVAFGALNVRTGVLVIAFPPLAGGLAYLVAEWRDGHDRAAWKITDSDPVDLIPLRSMTKFGLRVWFGSISGIALERLDQTVMVPLSSSHQLGLYAVAVSISEVTVVLNNAVRDVTFAVDSSDPTPARLTSSARFSGAVSLFLGLAISLSMILWLPIIFGDAFEKALFPCWILIGALALGTPGSVAGAGLSALGRPGLRSVSLLIAAIANAVAIVVLVPHLGAMGASISTFVGSTIAANLNIYFYTRRTGSAFLAFYGLRRSDLVELSLVITTRLSKVRAVVAGDKGNS